MADQTFRVNLNGASFPLLSEFGGPTVVLNGIDLDGKRSVTAAPGQQLDYQEPTYPTAIYLHNVLPTGQGYTSVSYQSRIANVNDADDFDEVIELRDGDENRYMLSPAKGKNYVYTANAGAWAQISPLAPGSWPHSRVTKANINGRTLLWYDRLGCFEFDPVGLVMTPVTLAGLTPSEILGIGSANNYALAFSASAVFWSSLIDETDFVPSLSTGAGYQIPQDLKGAIVGLAPLAGGFIIYTTRNAIHAQYSGNTRFPWIMKEIPACGGIATLQHVTYEANQNTQYAWTSAGLQEVSATGAKVIHTELTDFIGAQRLETYMPSTNTFVVTDLPSPLQVKLALVESRYLVLSYGQTTFSHALVYDIALKRWGKLKVDHIDCFDYVYPNLSGNLSYDALSPQTYDDLLGTTYDQLTLTQSVTAQPKKRFAFLQADGRVLVLDFTLAATDNDSVIVLGKFQLVRSRGIESHEVESECIDSQINNFELAVIPSIDGKTLLPPVPMYEAARAPHYRKHLRRTSGKNFCLRYWGTFNLVAVTVTALIAGKR